jgi:hypothetical protein
VCLQLPDELSVDDAAPDALLRKEARRSEALNLKVDYFENLSLTGIVGSILWGSALYFGVWFDINIKTNAVRYVSRTLNPKISKTSGVHCTLRCTVSCRNCTLGSRLSAPPHHT